MKHLKKLGSVLLALVMVLALAAPAFAAEVWDPDTDSTTHKITIGGDYKENYTYGVYQIFKGTEYPSATLNEVKWGYHLKGHEKAFVDALMADTELMKHYPANLLGADEVAPGGVTADTVAKKVADWLDAARVGLGEEKAAQILVDILSSQSVGVIGAVTSSTAWPILADETAEGYPTEYQSGYYLIQGKENIENSEPFYNLFQLTEDKVAAPKGAGDSDLDKKVAKQTVDAGGNEIQGDDLQWKDAADYNIGDKLKFKITAQLPDNFAILGAYEMLFTDTQDAGLANVTSFKAVLRAVDANGNKVANVADQELTLGTDYLLHLKQDTSYPTGWPTRTDAQNADAAFQMYIPNARAAGGTYKTFTDAHPNLKYQIVLTYDSQLTEDAAITGNSGNSTTPDVNADGNNNNIKLNCKWDGKESNYEDDTPVYTFEFDVDKTDGVGKVYGAKFALYQWKDDNTEELTDEQIKTAIAALTNGTLSAEEAAKWEEKTFVESDFEGDKTTDGAHFACEGLEAGNYMLIETKTPDDYNGLKAPIFFKLEAKYKDEGVKSKDEAKVTELKAMPYKEETLPGSTTASWVLDTATGSANTGDVDKGTVTMPVVNKQGTQLPETGGIGTTIFYIVGGVLVLGAVVLLITKRRTSVDDE